MFTLRITLRSQRDGVTQYYTHAYALSSLLRCCSQSLQAAANRQRAPRRLTTYRSRDDRLESRYSRRLLAARIYSRCSLRFFRARRHRAVNCRRDYRPGHAITGRASGIVPNLDSPLMRHLGHRVISRGNKGRRQLPAALNWE